MRTGRLPCHRLLIASIHKQQSALSTDPTTYKGLNFAECCGEPMQFNVTNGPVSTWGLVSNSYRCGRRPAAYDHMVATHPSISTISTRSWPRLTCFARSAGHSSPSVSNCGVESAMVETCTPPMEARARASHHGHDRLALGLCPPAE